MSEDKMRTECAEQIGEIKAKIHTLFKRTETMNNIQEIATRLSVLMEVTIEDNKKRDKILERQSQALEKVNANLTHLNDRNDDFESKIKNFEKRLGTEENKGKIDITKLWKKVLTNAVIGALSASIFFGAYMLIYFQIVCK